MLVELGVMDQRYHAVIEVVSGAPVTEVVLTAELRSTTSPRQWDRLDGVDLTMGVRPQPEGLLAGVPPAKRPSALRSDYCPEVSNDGM